MLPVFRKELGSYFGNVGAYIIALAFVVVSTLFLWFFDNDFNVFDIELASLNSFFILAPWLLMFLIPALTMKSIAEEEQNGTLIWLLSQPISITSIIIEKFLAILVLLIFIFFFTLIYVYTIYLISLPEGNIDLGTIFSGYIGLFFLSISFISIGIFSSSIVKNQVLAFIVGVFLCFISFFGIENLASYNLLGNFDYLLQKIGAFQHYKSFTKGIVDISDLGYFLFVTLSFILLSVQAIKGKK